MNTTRTLTTFAAAIALASGIGFAHALSGDGSTQGPATDTTSTPMQAPAPMQAQVPSTMPTPAADTGSPTTSATTSNDSSAVSVERAPKADRG